MGRYLGYVGLNNRRKRVHEVEHSNCEGGAVNRGANRKKGRSVNARENGISTGERECWSLIMHNVNMPMGREKTKRTMRLAIK
uniref:Uncharacterized protein n=1 Tax=viral metagenome TaxID=1070528 RepID=A0A6C0F2R1_9ZZZZ